MKAKVKTWLRNVENGNIRNFTEKILNEIKCNTINSDRREDWLEQLKKGISTYELRESLGISHQTLTSVLSNLTDEGLIKSVGETEVNGSFYSIYMFIEDIEYRKRLITLREREKFSQWLKNAKKYEHLLSVDMKLEINSFLWRRGEEMLFKNVRTIEIENLKNK